jgi:hypothetical protein
LTLAASLIGTVSPSAFARPHNSSQGDQGTTVNYKSVIGETRTLGQDHQDRDEARRHRLFIRQPWFWYVSSGYYAFGPDCVPVVLNPEQQAFAQERVEAYLAAVRLGLRRAPNHRYLAIETLPVTEGGRCVTVYDIRTGSFVGHGGYTVGGLPPVGSVARLASVRAELVV